MVGTRSKLSNKGRTANMVGDLWRTQYGGHRQLLSNAVGSSQRKADKRHEKLYIAKDRGLEAPQRVCAEVHDIIGGRISSLFKDREFLIEFQAL